MAAHQTLLAGSPRRSNDGLNGSQGYTGLLFFVSVTQTLPAPSPCSELGNQLVTDVVEVRVAQSASEIEELRCAWSRWCPHRDSDLDYCLSLVWARQEVLRPHVVTVYRNGSPDALLVGRVERTHMKPKIGYMRLPATVARVIMFSYRGLLGNASPENCDAIVQSILDSLQRGDADVASLHQLNIDSPLYQRVLQRPNVGCRDYLARPVPHHFMLLAGDVDQIYSGLSSSHRKALRYEAKRLATQFAGNVVVRCFITSGELDKAISDIEIVARETYQRDLGFGVEDNPQMRNLLAFLSVKGWLRIHVLYLGGAPAAFSLGTVSNGVYCCDHLGYRPKFAKYSPGSFLLTKVFDDLCANHVNMVDFGPGDGLYKARFGNLQVMESSVNIFAPTGRGVWLNGIRTSAGFVDLAARKVLEKANLSVKVKKKWRALSGTKKVPKDITA